MRIYPIIRENIKSVFLDFSLPVVLIITMGINLILGLNNNILKDVPNPDPFWFMLFFDSLIFIIYGGYIGTKYFAREFDKNTISSLISTPAGKNGVYAGKIIAGLITSFLLAIIVYLQIIVFLLVWGPPPLLFFYWYGIYAVIIFLSTSFAIFVAISFGVILKKTGITLVISSGYAIFSFFILAFMPMDFIIDDRIYYMIFFPSLGVWYLRLSISNYAIVFLPSLLLCFLGTMFIFTISYLVYKGVRI